MAYLLRVVLPDRPGSLGALAMALGAAGADIVSVDVVERNPDGAVDDIVVEVPTGALADTLIVSTQRVSGVSVVSLQPHPSGLDIHRELALLEGLAAEPQRARELLARDAPHIFHAGWAVVVTRSSDGSVRRVSESAAAPETLACEGVDDIPWLPLDKACVLETSAPWVPPTWARLDTMLAAAPVGDASTVLLVGRPGGPPYLASEVLRLGHLAGIAGTVARAAE